MAFEEAIKYAMKNLAREKELWIIEELKPCFDYDNEKGIATLKESYRFKFQQIEDYKQEVTSAIYKICVLELGEGQGRLNYQGITLLKELRLE